MYSFEKEQIEIIKQKALECLGQAMKYKELCSKLELPYAAQSKSKAKQLHDLQTIIEIQETNIGKQKGYIITQVYDHLQLPYYDNDEWYAAIKSQICSIFRDNPNKQWFVRTELLAQLGAVNNNYKAIMSQTDRTRLTGYYKRRFDNEEAVCRIMGGILADRIYNALIRMEKERLVIYTNGYVLLCKFPNYLDKDKSQKERIVKIEAPYDPKNDSLFGYLYNLESDAIDDVAKTYDLYKPDTTFKNRQRIKSSHFESFLDFREKRVKSNEVLAHLKKKYPDIISVEAILDVKFITPVWAANELTIPYKPYAKEIINKASQENILTSTDKRLDRYNNLIDGAVKVFIDADTDIDYKELLKSLE